MQAGAQASVPTSPRTFAQIAIKGFMSMLFDDCGGPVDPCVSSPVFWLCGAIVIACAGSTMSWIKIVFTRYEVTRALPIEYGTLNKCVVLSGVIFYREHVYMEGYQLACCFAGLVVVLVGVGMSAMESLPCCKQTPGQTLGDCLGHSGGEMPEHGCQRV